MKDIDQRFRVNGMKENLYNQESRFQSGFSGIQEMEWHHIIICDSVFKVDNV